MKSVRHFLVTLILSVSVFAAAAALDTNRIAQIISKAAYRRGKPPATKLKSESFSGIPPETKERQINMKMRIVSLADVVLALFVLSALVAFGQPKGDKV